MLWIAKNQPQTCLTVEWAFCATSPGAIVNPSELVGLHHWRTAPLLGPVADQLRQLDEWSLDTPPKKFDAEDWWYRLNFDYQNFQAGEGVDLIFDGLATLAEVWLNGKHLLTSSNMFLQQQVSVADCLKAEGNDLVMVFRSLDQHLAPRRSRPRWRVPMLEQQQLRWVRTTLLGRTPGWSPSAAVVGPWRGIRLAARQAITLQSLTLKPTVEAATGRLAIRCGFEHSLRAIQTVTLILGRAHQRFEVVLKRFSGESESEFSAELTIETVALWWPHTHGEPALYQAELHVNAVGSDTPLIFDLGAVGFRRVSVQREQDGFTVNLNGTAVFCRGACWTPLDPVTLHVSAERYRTAIAQVCAAGMNMLRVSGTMVYEADAFYAACAEQGVMVWQDFMFASMDYPNDIDFQASVQLETEQQLARWQACPALTILCGNSEVEQQAAMWAAPREFWNPPLFHNLMAEVSARVCPDIPYWPSSAHGGTFPHQNNVGTTSYYGVGAYLKPIEDARRSQVVFATECLAFANVPEIANIQKIPSPSGLIKVHHPRWKERIPRDLGAGWDFEDVRDFYLAQYFGVDPLQLRYAEHDRYLLLSRVVTGEVMAATFNEWRSSQSHCQGGLVWFLRDLTPGAGWGLIDNNGNPKAAYYYLKRVLQPVSVSISDEGTNGLFVHLINEQAKALEVDLNVTVYQAGQTILANISKHVTLPPRSVQAYPLMAWFEQFLDLSNAYRFGPALADAVQVQFLQTKDQPLSEAFYFPSGYKHLPLRDLGLIASVRLVADGDAIVTLTCSRLAIAVYFEVEGFIPDENYFHLAPHCTKTVTMRALHKRKIGIFGYVGAINAAEMVTITLETPI